MAMLCRVKIIFVCVMFAENLKLIKKLTALSRKRPNNHPITTRKNAPLIWVWNGPRIEFMHLF